MYMHRFSACLIFAPLFLTTACSLTETLKSDVAYHSARRASPLEVPPDIAQIRYGEGAVSTDALTNYSTFSDNQKAANQVTGVVPEVANMQIKRLGGSRWLHISDRSPEQIWPKLKLFWSRQGLVVEKEDPLAGVMETNWAERVAKFSHGALRDLLSKALGTSYASQGRDRYRTRVERSTDGRATDVYITHRGMKEMLINAATDDFRWQEMSPDEGLEAIMLQRLMVFLGVPQSKAEQITKEDAKPRADEQDNVASLQVDKRGGQTGGQAAYISMPANFDRAWRQVGLALDRAGFTVKDHDRSLGWYEVLYANPDTRKSGGFFSRIFGGEKELSNEHYRVLIQENVAGNSIVRVRRSAGESDKGEEHAGNILAIIREKLR